MVLAVDLEGFEVDGDEGIGAEMGTKAVLEEHGMAMGLVERYITMHADMHIDRIDITHAARTEPDGVRSSRYPRLRCGVSRPPPLEADVSRAGPG